MKITIESTDRVIEIAGRSQDRGVPARVWEGHTESGIPVIVLVSRIAVPAAERQEEFTRELQICAAPSQQAVEAFPLRLLL